MLRDCDNDEDRNKSAGDEPMRQVRVPQDVEQNHVKRDKSCDEERQHPASGREVAVFRQGFDPFAELGFSDVTVTAGASAST